MCFSVESCCGCVGLAVGVQVISVLSVVSYSNLLICIGIVACSAKCFLFTVNVFSSSLSVTYATAAQVLIPATRATFYSAMALLFAGQATTGALLSYAAFSNKHSLMWPWLVLTWSLAASLGVLALTGAAAAMTLTAIDGAVVSFYAVYSLVHLYLAAVVNSRRCELERQERTQSAAAVETTTWRFV